MKKLKSQILQALRMQYAGMMEMHRANIDIYLTNPLGLESIQMFWVQLIQKSQNSLRLQRN